jgi:hypothetical protein
MMKQTFISVLSVLLLFSCAGHQKVQESHSRSKYLRSDWNHWSDSDGDCLNTRAEILKERSLVAVVTNKKGCTVKTGKWKDYYYPEIHTSASKVDIDHLIPLKHAHGVGGANWSELGKEKFANDPENLVITNRSYNRQKGAKSIAEWLPRHKDYACKYVSDWIRIKKKYALKLRDDERQTIESLKGECHI